MRILGPIVLPSTALMMALDPEIASGSAIRAQVVGDYPIGDKAVFLEKLAHQFQRGMLVSLGLDQHIEDFAFGVDGAPQIEHAASDLQIDHVQMPCRVRLWTPFAQVHCDHRTEMVYPPPDCFVGDRDPTFRQQILDVAQAQGEPKIEPDRPLNDLRRKTVPGVTDFLHPPGYRDASGQQARRRRDNAARTHRTFRAAAMSTWREVVA